MSDHLSAYALAQLAGSGDVPPPHVRDCAQCRQTFERLCQDVADFEPAARQQRAALSTQSARPGRRLWLPALGTSLAAGLALFVLTTGDPDPAENAPTGAQPVGIGAPAGEPSTTPRSTAPALGSYKGQLGVSLSRVTPDGLVLADTGARVGDGDAVQMTLTASEPQWVVVASVDAQGAVSPLYPDTRSGSPLAIAAGRSALPEAIVFDDAPDHEYLAVIASSSPFPTEQAYAALASVHAAIAAERPPTHQQTIGPLRVRLVRFDKR